ncbi:hypothetical protein XH87_02805 [Bradyrhizobium sp. CCBAU 53415]|nr:hypothetical protein [Bradyrhizobium sp. CCBAU 53415]
MMAILPFDLRSQFLRSVLHDEVVRRARIVAIRITTSWLISLASRAGRHGLFWDQMGAGPRFF